MRTFILLLASVLAGGAWAQTATERAEQKARLEQLQREEELQSARLEQLQREQEALLNQVKAQLKATEDSSRKAQLAALLAEIEHRIKTRRHANIFLTSAMKKTPEMQAYYERLVKKIEYCGTKHYPKRDGKSVYGDGVMMISVRKDGTVLKTEIERSSNDAKLDRHMVKVVQASAPFGLLPKQLIPGTSRPFENLVVVQSFVFKQDDTPVPSDEHFQCRWK